MGRTPCQMVTLSPCPIPGQRGQVFERRRGEALGGGHGAGLTFLPSIWLVVLVVWHSRSIGPTVVGDGQGAVPL